MGFVYPRTITITRPAPQEGEGAIGYGGQTPAMAEPVEGGDGLPASIQLRREGQKSPVGLPGDGTAPYWDIFIPRRAAARSLINGRDLVTDDLGDVYQVSAPYWDSMGYRLRCMKLEA